MLMSKLIALEGFLPCLIDRQSAAVFSDRGVVPVHGQVKAARGGQGSKRERGKRLAATGERMELTFSTWTIMKFR